MQHRAPPIFTGDADDLESRIRLEQIRLIYEMDGSTIFPTLCVAVIMALTLRNATNSTSLGVWLAVMVATRIWHLFAARRYLAKPVAVDRIATQQRWMMLIHGFHAASWSVLVWIALKGATPTQAILMISVLCGIVGGAVSLLSPVPRVFAAYIVADLVVLFPRFVTMHDPAYTALGLMTVAYIASMALQGRNSYRATRRSILLGFQNVALNTSLAREVDRSLAAHAEAVAANRAKSTFLAAASHDLRQPIHALRLFLSVLDQKAKLPEQEKIIANANSAADASSEMLETLLDFSRVEAGAIQPQPVVFALQDLFDAIEIELAPLADEKQLTFRARATALHIHSDPALVELIVRNLVANAIRYTTRGGLLLGARRWGAQVVIEVWDTGIGIPQDQFGEIFREFHQLGNPARDRKQGLGLGLAISSGLATVLGTSLGLASRLGRGTVFRIALPLAVPPAADENEVPAQPPSVSLVGCRVLVLEDDDIIRTAMGELLASWGMECGIAATPDEAAKWLATAPPDLIICDYRLGGEHSGIAAIARLRKLAGHPLPALLITGDTDPERIREASAQDFSVLHKPLAHSKLRDAIARALGNGSGARNTDAPADRPPGHR